MFLLQGFDKFVVNLPPHTAFWSHRAHGHDRDRSGGKEAKEKGWAASAGSSDGGELSFQCEAFIEGSDHLKGLGETSAVAVRRAFGSQMFNSFLMEVGQVPALPGIKFFADKIVEKHNRSTTFGAKHPTPFLDERLGRATQVAAPLPSARGLPLQWRELTTTAAAAPTAAAGGFPAASLFPDRLDPRLLYGHHLQPEAAAAATLPGAFLSPALREGVYKRPLDLSAGAPASGGAVVEVAAGGPPVAPGRGSSAARSGGAPSSGGSYSSGGHRSSTGRLNIFGHHSKTAKYVTKYRSPRLHANEETPKKTPKSPMC